MADDSLLRAASPSRSPAEGSAEQRRRARAAWPVRKFRLGEEPADDMAGTTVEERVEMVWQLTLDAWSSAGREIPTYRRSEMPVRVLHKGEQADAQ